MSHPFEKMFERALKNSSADENLVLDTAEKLIEKGYRAEEICGVLLKLEKSLVDDKDAEIVHEAREEVCGELEEIEEYSG